MRIFCPATLSVLFLPRFVVPPESGRTTSSAQSLTWAATVRTLGDRDTPDPLPLFICHGSPVHAVGRVALPLILRPRFETSPGLERLSRTHPRWISSEVHDWVLLAS